MRRLAMIMGGDCGGAAVGWRTNWVFVFGKFEMTVCCLYGY